MALQTLKSGSSLKIRKDDGSALNKVRVEITWDANGPRKPYDLDVTAIEVTGGVIDQSMGTGVAESRVCYFGQKTTPAMNLDGDNRTGGGETIKVDLSKVDSTTDLIHFIVTIYDGHVKGQDFTQIKGAKAVLVNDETNQPLAETYLDTTSAGTTAVLFSALVKDVNGWNFAAINQSFQGKQIVDFFKLLGLV